MTIEIAPTPLLWVIPLATYLITFVLIFKKDCYCPRWINSHYHLLLGFGILLYFLMKSESIPVLIVAIVLIGITFSFCIFAHFKLYSMKPSDHSQLPQFYFYMSLGGFFGGAFVTWIVPIITSGLLEYFCGLLAISIALQMDKKSQIIPWNMVLIGLFLALMFTYPIMLPNYNFLGLVVLVGCVAIFFSRIKNDPLALTGVIILIISFSNIIAPLWSKDQLIYKKRNYYGINKIYDKDSVRHFLHGTTVHGAQYLDKERQSLPLTYFALDGPVGQILTSKLYEFKNIGILGLGIGTISTYVNSAQTIDYFELDPDVLDLARKYFTFLGQSRGQTQVFIGDARLKLNEIEPNKYDILIADAFSGDSLPTHLLTEEALAAYRKYIKPEGVILFNISNRYIDSGYPLLSAAISLGANGCYKNGKTTYSNTYSSTWIAITWDDDSYNKLISEFQWNKVPKIVGLKYRKWTDKYSSILPYIKYGELWNNVKKFKVFNIQI